MLISPSTNDAGDRKKIPSANFLTVAIGASAGGLEFLEYVFKAEPTILSPMNQVLDLLIDQYKLNFNVYKMATIARRVERRLALSTSQELGDYAETLRAQPDELDRLYRDLWIGVTGFFRDAAVFERLELDVIPSIFESVEDGGEVRCWSVATAIGEEAYSIAMLFDEACKQRKRDLRIRVCASDVHPGSLAAASRGVSPAESPTGLTPERMETYFIERKDGFHVVPDLRKTVVFTRHNCISDAPFTKDEFVPFDERLPIYRKHRDATFPTGMRFPTSPPPANSSSPKPRRAFGKFVSPENLLPIYDDLLGQFMPPSLLLGERRELLHSFRGAGKFLCISDGRPSADALDLIHPSLRHSLDDAFRRVCQENEPIQVVGNEIELDGGHPIRFDLLVQPFRNDEDNRRSFLVIFQEHDEASNEPPLQIDSSQISNEDVASLERELKITRDNLQSTVEQAQTTNEELQSANEQLTAAIEELQSTNEELHSVNEELYTVNAEHQRKIDELTEITADMDNLLNSTNVDTIFLDLDLRVRRFTPGIGDSFNLIPQDIGRRFDSFSHQFQDSDFSRIAEKVLETGDVFEREVCDQKGKWYLLRVLPYRCNQLIDGAVLTLIDIHHLKTTQAELFELSEIVEHSDDAIYRIDLNGIIRTWNLGACKLYGYEKNQVVNKNILLLTPDSLRGEDLTFLDRLRQGISIDRTETKRLRNSGAIVDVSLTVSPIRDNHGQVVGASVISRDITRQKQAELEIRKAIQHRDRFLAMLSHELRNPLSAILNATSLLKEDSLDAESANEARTVVDNQLRHVARLLDDLLDVARITNGKLTMKTDTVDLCSLMLDVVDCVQYQIDEKEQKLVVQSPMTPIYVRGDIGRLQQAQVNLLVNASKYSPNGVPVHFSIEQQGQEARIRVRDEGHGIPESLLPTMFEPFVQAEQTIERTQGGMGLGLPLVRMIAEAHNGSITAHSEGIGRGSEFVLTLPATPDKPHESTESHTALLNFKRILLVEDNDGIRRMLARSLQLKGFDVAASTNGKKGLDLYVDFKPELAVIDIGLPDVNGYDVAKSIRSKHSDDETILVAVTGYGQESDWRMADEAGFDLHLIKPIDPDELLSSVAEFFAEREAADPANAHVP